MRIINIAIIFVFTGLALTFGCSKSYNVMKIEGTAMLPSFKDGDRILVETNIREMKRGEVIFFYAPINKTQLFFKRVVGLPGETIEVRDGITFVNGKELGEPYLDQTCNQLKGNFPPRKISAGSYYVLGDNRDNSYDSRHWGTVDKELIVGKYYLTYLSS